MKKSYIYIAAISAALSPQASYAAASICSAYDLDIRTLSQWTGTCPKGAGATPLTPSGVDPWANCKTKGYYCYYNQSGESIPVASCTECLSGYSLTSATTSTPHTCSNTVEYYKCVPASGSGGTSSATCDKTACEANNNTYYNYIPGYQVSYKYNCSSGSCVKSSIVSYRCAANYYGNSGSTSPTGCQPCPSVTDKDGNEVQGFTAGPGKASKTDCFMATNVTMKDSTGEYQFNSLCYYKE